MNQLFGTILFRLLDAWWLALLASVALASTAALVYARRGALKGPPPISELALLFIAPPLLLLLALVFNSAAAESGGKWTFHAVLILSILLAELVLGGFMVWRQRRRWAVALPFSVVGILLSLYAWFFASMAIYDDWI